MFTQRRSPSRIDVYNYNTLLYHDFDSSINYTKSFLFSQSPPPMTYRDLRSVMSNVRSSNIVILPETLNSSETLTKNSPQQIRRKNLSRKKHKRQSVNIYRTLPRSESRCSVLSEHRNITNDEMMQLHNAFVIDHITPSPTSGFFHPQNLPNIQKHRINNNRSGNSQTKSPSLRIRCIRHTKLTPADIQYEDNGSRISLNKSSYSSSSSLRLHQTSYTRPTPPQSIHPTTPVDDVQYEEKNSQTTLTTTTAITEISPPIPKAQTRKQLHVYMPQTLSC
jgi:hypothetical protein